jgi:hypothetical protein
MWRSGRAIAGWEAEAFRTQGEGKIWRFASMDEEAQQKISIACIQSYAATVPDAHETEPLEAKTWDLWEAFNKKSDKAKERAFYKHSLLLECWRLHLEGTPITYAFALVAQQHGVSEDGLRNWYFGTTASKAH